ncbi:MAG: tetratricopeptide repeat protein [Cocleimonas sp.]|nr:tetratricopeptide repeat protein [Cocleimonas sp.]
MIEILFLLLPLAFYSGWRAASKDNKKQCEASNKLTDDYVKGVNYLLSEKPDKALEVFINHPDVDEYTAETYLLLGNMFRNRGEVDRALCLHQNLMARSSLNKHQKALVMFALGEDYLSAGMLDRAERVFQELLEEKPKNIDVCLPLRRIYEQTNEWEKAIEATNCLKSRKISVVSKQLIAHYYCEMADQEMLQGNLHQVEKYIKKAEKTFKSSTRVKVLQADLLARQKYYKKSFRLYLNVLKQDSRLLSSLFDRVTKVAIQTGQNKVFSHALFELYAHDDSVLAYLLTLISHDGANHMPTQFLIEDLSQKKLNIYSINKAIETLQKTPDITSEGEKLSLIKQALDNYLKGKAGFQCQHCGYKMQDYLWHCPACYQWDVVSHT